MKGFSFQNGVEFKIAIEGESWFQGDRISGKLESKSAAGASAPLSVFLAEALDRKVKSKTPGAFKVIDQATSPTSPMEWSFSLARDAMITDHLESLYILYGSSSELDTLGQLRVTIKPHQQLLDFVDVVTHQFRFALKNIVAGKDDWVDVKLDAPEARDWTYLDQLILQMKLTDTTLEARFQFHRKEVDGMKAGLSTKISKREVNRSLELKQIVHDFNQRLNKEIAFAAIESVIAEYRNESGWLNS